MNTSRWRAWRPKGDPIIGKVGETEPPKPPEVTFEGFAGATSELFPIARHKPEELDAAASQILRWIEARCARRRDAWGAERFLWRDYNDWSQENKQGACPRALFRETLNQSFDREANGWLGIALAIDVAASRYIV